MIKNPEVCLGENFNNLLQDLYVPNYLARKMKSEIPRYPRWGLYTQFSVIVVSLFLLELRRPVPGVAISILALVAVIVTIRAEYKWDHPEQIVWMLIACVLFYVEIRTIYRDRDEFAAHEAAVVEQENTHHEKQMSKMDEIRKTENSLLQSTDALLNRPVRNVPVVEPHATDLRTKGIELSRNMLSFILARQQKDPSLDGYQFPGFAIPSDENGKQRMPLYGKETLAQFSKRFDTDLKGVYSEFSARGLGESSTLSAVARWSPEEIEGNPYDALRILADEIRDYSLELPASGMYSRVSDAQLASMLISESSKIQGLADAAFKQMISNLSQRNNAIAHFMMDFDSCCRDEVTGLRNEAMARLGPSYKDLNEMMFYRILTDQSTTTSIRSAATLVTTVREYAPYLKNLGEELTHKH